MRVTIALLSATLLSAAVTAHAKQIHRTGNGDMTPPGSSASSPWAKFCGRERNPDGSDAGQVCFTGSTGQLSVTAVVIEPAGARGLLRIALPAPTLGIDLGTDLIIDQDPPLKGRISTCHGGRCLADHELTPDLLAKLKGGRMMQVQAVDLNGKIVTFTLPLSEGSGTSFREAREAAPATDPQLFAKRQKELAAYAGRLPVPAVRDDAWSYSPWERYCDTRTSLDAPDAKEVCFTHVETRTAHGQPVLTATLIEPTGDPDNRMLRITLSSPVRTDFGIQLTIDDAPALTGRFFTCYADGCAVDYRATPELVAKLKGGRMMQVKAIDLADEAVTFTLPLAPLCGKIENLITQCFSFPKVAEAPAADRRFDEQQTAPREDPHQRAEVIHHKLERPLPK